MSEQPPSTPTPPARAFDPSRHLTNIGGNDYLEVKWRIVWFRADYPAGRIVTELVHHSDQHAIFRAEVTAIDADGVIRGSATGWGDEDTQGFRDFLTKAETKSIGRALAALGYGTQFCADFESSNLADAPVSRERREQARQGREARRNAGPTEKQMGFIRTLARDLNLAEGQLNQHVENEYGAPIDALSGAQVSELIDRLKDRKARNERQGATS